MSPLQNRQATLFMRERKVAWSDQGDAALPPRCRLQKPTPTKTKKKWISRSYMRICTYLFCLCIDLLTDFSRGEPMSQIRIRSSDYQTGIKMTKRHPRIKHRLAIWQKTSQMKHLKWSQMKRIQMKTSSLHVFFWSVFLDMTESSLTTQCSL